MSVNAGHVTPPRPANLKKLVVFWYLLDPDDVTLSYEADRWYFLGVQLSNVSDPLVIGETGSENFSRQSEGSKMLANG
jgi:hypothetical protein